ncbi:hypothetical protein [Methylomonas albis]|uniref:PEP-CTERM sorting domain-containing protein n=1 Tax=Methylomonas albis TaxID=1854563 RepID=A0ABR9CWN5_9GAMM|nr:hypothetical protein [Methylomonas albis]MBD9355287.1 hypothetical protein [Methylomonas albis]
MKFLSSLNGAALLAAVAFGNGAAQASVAYNIQGWDGGVFFGASDGRTPGTWIGGAAPVYTGSVSTPWYADITTGITDVVSNAGAHAAGADPLYELAVGPMGWNRNVANSGMGHGADVGLIKLESAADLTITVSADSLTPSNLTTVIKPGFSLFQGWDTSSTVTTAAQKSAYATNANNPFGSAGLTYLNGIGGTGSSVSFLFTNLAAGDYTLILGGNAGGGHGDYSVTFASTAPVPLPAAVWLFGSALVGGTWFSRRKAS